MSGAGSWALHTLAGGGLLLLLARLLAARVHQPARRQRLGECAAAAALLLAGLSLGPAWLLVPLPFPGAAPPAKTAPPVNEPVASPDSPPPARPPVPLDAVPELSAAHETPDEEPAAPVVVAVPEEATDARADPRPEPPSPPAVDPWTPWRTWLAFGLTAAYGLGAALLLGRWLLGHFALAHLLRRATPAPHSLVRLLEETVPGARARVLLSRRVRVPFSAGLLRPVIVLPAALAAGPAAMLRWVLLHEAAHLARRDAWGSLLFGVGQVLFFPLPWFWWLRRQVHLCQEYLADAAAVAAGARPADYAEFLLAWTAAPPPPAAATGVSGQESDLFRRVVMLLQSPFPVERRCPRRWSALIAGAFLSLAVLAAGVGVRASAADPVPDNPAPKKEEPRRADPKAADPDLPLFPPGFEERLLEQLRGAGADPDDVRRLQDELQRSQQELKRALEMARRQGGAGGRGGLGGLGALQIGPEGLLLNRRLLQNGRDTRPRGLEPRFGAILAAPDATLTEQLDLPRGQGLVLGTILPDSAAAKAGLRPHDVLLELNGKAVPSSLDEFARQTDAIKAGDPVDATVLRKGKKETVKGLTLPEAPPQRVAPRPGLNLNRFQFPEVFPQGNTGRLPLGVDIARDGDSFKTTKKDDDLLITVTGKLTMNKATVSEIVIEDAGRVKKYDSVEAVPEPYDQMVRDLVKVTENPPPARGNGFNGVGRGINMSRTNDGFRVTQTDGDVSVTVAGRVEGGKAVPTEILIKEGAKTNRYEKVEDVPQAHRGEVQDLLRMGETGRVGITIRGN